MNAKKPTHAEVATEILEMVMEYKDGDTTPALKWGQGSARTQKIKDEGYDYYVIKLLINERLGGFLNEDNRKW